MKPLDLVGHIFGKLTIINRADNNKYGHSFFYCLCECGKTKRIASRSLVSGKTISCGCHGRNVVKTASKTHGQSKTKIYLVWKEMRARCNRRSHRRYNDYGGRGITVCKRWDSSFEDFAKDMGKRPKGHTIERINNDSGYTPSNCKWATYAEQNKNKRNV